MPCKHRYDRLSTGIPLSMVYTNIYSLTNGVSYTTSYAPCLQGLVALQHGRSIVLACPETCTTDCSAVVADKVLQALFGVRLCCYPVTSRWCMTSSLNMIAVCLGLPVQDVASTLKSGIIVSVQAFLCSVTHTLTWALCVCSGRHGEAV